MKRYSSAPWQPRPVCVSPRSDEGRAALRHPSPHRRSSGAAGSLGRETTRAGRAAARPQTARQPSGVRGLWESGRETPSLNTLWEDFFFLMFLTYSLRISRSSRPEPRVHPRPAQQAARDGGDAGTRWEHRGPWTGCPQES